MPQAPPVVTSSTAASLRAAPTQFTCTWREGGSGAAWVHVAGELDLATSPLLGHALRDAQLYARVVVLDLREVTFIESTGVHVVLDAAASVRRGDGRLILVRGPTHVDRALTLTDASSQVLIVDLDPSDPPARALLHLAQHELVVEGSAPLPARRAVGE
jgi:anti-anti-sigma factor